MPRRNVTLRISARRSRLRRGLRYRTRRYRRYTFRRRKVANQVTVLKRTFEGPVITGANMGAGTGLSFQLASLPSVTDITNLYDHYKLKLIVVRFEPTFSQEVIQSESAAINLAANLKHYRVAHDYNDASNPASESVLFEYSNMKSYPCHRPFKVLLYPKVAEPVFGAGINPAAYQARRSGWIDTAYTNVLHYGLKIWVPVFGNVAAGAYICRTIVTYYIACKNAK